MWAELGDSPVAQLAALARAVMLPALAEPAATAGVPAVLAQDVADKLHRLSATGAATLDLRLLMLLWTGSLPYPSILVLRIPLTAALVLLTQAGAKASEVVGYGTDPSFCSSQSTRLCAALRQDGMSP